MKKRMNHVQFWPVGSFKELLPKNWESLAVTHIFLLKSRNERPHICDRPWLLSKSTSHNFLNLWAFLVSKPSFFKLIVSREDYGNFSEESNFHEAFQAKKKREKS